MSGMLVATLPTARRPPRMATNGYGADVFPTLRVPYSTWLQYYKGRFIDPVAKTQTFHFALENKMFSAIWRIT
jgi:hypothetical protein